jgi:hypothetical protein
MREIGLNQSQAEQVSDHFPVWAEFSAYERDYAGRIASRGATTGFLGRKRKRRASSSAWMPLGEQVAWRRDCPLSKAR